ncbi:TetR/AcrR family transcriptional regulator [Polyangium mundeleinium]|uniref:TetR/AcrR family transcriptional regulator n=1 Tax=Polyangium mundeleinium TaxID=2995306 RepID=A0ABT5EGN7_9BACT|nr:TetR/AcrR family transcriptional regulator [Polyangium mundeleinium]MDC0740373.1 TetR/AcrR family transcriptional regulator [Polyangium mundeleinium]
MTTRKRRPSGEANREHILSIALGLFREKGFDGTTMRDIAAAAGLSLGAAYYWFPSKEALVLAYYARQQDAHAEAARGALESIPDLRARLGAVMHAKIDMLKDDRKLLRAILRSTLGADEPTSVFSEETSDVRRKAIAAFHVAIGEDESIPEDARPLFAQALWTLHLGLLLYFVNDTSEDQGKTRALVDGSLDLVCKLAPLIASPMLGPMRAEITALLENAGLFAAKK